jgi:hypothetical protein
MLASNPAYRNDWFDERAVLSFPQFMADLAALRFRNLVMMGEGLLSNAFNSAFPERVRIHNRLRNPMRLARTLLLARFGQSVVAVFPKLKNAWAIDLDRPSQRLSEAEMQTLLVRNRERGALGAEFYSTESSGSAALVHLIRTARATGAAVVVAVLPEHSAFRKEIPSNAIESLKAVLQDNFGNDQPRLIDIRDLLADDLFYDFYHATPAAKPLITPLLRTG